MTTTPLSKAAITPRGVYDPATPYKVLDLVTYNGARFLVLQNVTGVTPTSNGATYQFFGEKAAPAPQGCLGSIDRGVIPVALTGSRGYIEGMVPLEDGGMIISGSFKAVNGTTVPRANVAKLSADGVVDMDYDAPLFPEADSYWDACVDAGGGKIYQPGRYQTADGVPCILARLMADGSLDPTFNHAPTEPDPDDYYPDGRNISRWMVVLPDGTLLVNDGTGNPYLIKDQKSCWARLNPDGSLADVQPPPIAAEYSGLYTVAVTDAGKIIAQLGALGQENYGLVFLNADFTVDASLSLSVGGPVEENLAVNRIYRVGDSIYICGTFESCQGHPTYGVARLDQQFNVDTTFSVPPITVAGYTEEDAYWYMLTLVFYPSGLIGGVLVNDNYDASCSVGGLVAKNGYVVLNPEGSVNLAFYQNQQDSGLFAQGAFVNASGYTDLYTINIGTGVYPAFTLKPDGSLLNAPVNLHKTVTVPIVSGVATIDPAVGEVFDLTLAANVNKTTIASLPPFGEERSFALVIHQDATTAHTWKGPAGAKYAGGTPVIPTALGAEMRIDFRVRSDGTIRGSAMPVFS